MLFSPSSLPIMPMLYTSLGYNPMTDFAHGLDARPLSEPDRGLEEIAASLR